MMRELFKKLGSLTLGASALSLVLANAAMTHGCARSSATQTQATAEGPSGAGATVANAKWGGFDDPCRPPAYMYATKAPIFVPPGCPGSRTPAQPQPIPQAQQPIPASNAAQQAP